MNRMFLTGLVLLLALPARAGETIEVNIKSHCIIEASGKKLMDTICNMMVTFPDDICVGCLPDVPDVLPKYFVIINDIRQEKTLIGDAHWNAGAGGHADESLGEISYVGDYCWANDAISVCAVPTYPRPRK